MNLAVKFSRHRRPIMAFGLCVWIVFVIFVNVQLGRKSNHDLEVEIDLEVREQNFEVLLEEIKSDLKTFGNFSENDDEDAGYKKEFVKRVRLIKGIKLRNYKPIVGHNFVSTINLNML